MVSLAAQNLREPISSNVQNGEQFQQSGDIAPASVSLDIKLEAEHGRAQRVDDAIELEQDAARLARNAIGISHKIATTNQGISQKSTANAVQASKNAAQRAIPKDPVSDRRLTHYQHRQSPDSAGGAKKRNLLGEPPKQVIMHRPSGAHSVPGSVVVS